MTRPSPTVVVLGALLGTRLPVLLLGALAVTIVGTVPPPVAEALWRVSPHELTNLLARWDTFFYSSIAAGGYRHDPAIFQHENIVFFPLYPLLMRWGGALLGGHPLLAGVIISLAAFAVAMVLLYRLAVLEVGEAHAGPVVLLLSTFPFALFYSAVYTESLFLCVTLGAFYAMRRGRLGWAAVCGLAAGLCRPNGLWLAVPLLCLAASPRPRVTGGDDRSPAVSHRLAMLAACAPIVGMILVSAYMQFRFGDAILWVHGQAAWGAPLLGRSSAPDPVRLAGEPTVKLTEAVVYLGDIAAFVIAAAAIRPVARRFGIAYGLWIAVNLVPPVVAHLFISLGRFTSVLFPLFFWLAIRIPREKVWLVAGAFAAGQALFAVWFFLWQPVV
jgi:Mannosyltransferase (PIG-V)